MAWHGPRPHLTRVKSFCSVDLKLDGLRHLLSSRFHNIVKCYHPMQSNPAPHSDARSDTFPSQKPHTLGICSKSHCRYSLLIVFDGLSSELIYAQPTPLAQPILHLPHRGSRTDLPGLLSTHPFFNCTHHRHRPCQTHIPVDCQKRHASPAIDHPS
jgi:hypothetical protein